MPRTHLPIEERFKKKFKISSIHFFEGTPCWEWLGYLTPEGYARFRDTNKNRQTEAHRFSYEHHVGPIPPGLVIDHRCQNRCCVNPRHLQAITGEENRMLVTSRGTTYLAKTHCVHGHELTGVNVFFYRGNRLCLICRNPSTIQRFDKKYRVSSNQFYAGTPCWLWTGRLNSDGYGEFWDKDNLKTKRCHRFSYEYHVGPIPEGIVLDHLCKVRHCVNPSHLEPVTQAENSLRGDGPAAKHARQTHCKNGHELAGDNVYINKGKRLCKVCRRIKCRADYKTNKARINQIKRFNRAVASGKVSRDDVAARECPRYYRRSGGLCATKEGRNEYARLWQRAKRAARKLAKEPQ